MGFITGLISGARKVLGRVLPVAKQIGSFIGRNHATIAGVGLGLANLSGSDTLKKIANTGVAVSNMATMRQNLNQQNQQAHQARMAVGRPNGVYDASTGKVT